MREPYPATPRVAIRYCRRCGFFLRAAWLAQELISSLGELLGEVALVGGDSGVLEIYLDGECLFARSEAGRFPEAKEVKQLVRDRLDPQRDLGHSDRPG